MDIKSLCFMPDKQMTVMRTKRKNQQNIQPLCIILEKHLYDFQDSNIDRSEFIENIVEDYIGFLRQSCVAIPKAYEKGIREELAIQVKEMLLKKIYGFSSITEYKKKTPVKIKRSVNDQYRKLRVRSKTG